jgi:hypothetical protein
MGAWGTGLYSGDFATDLRAVVAAVSRLPLDEEGLVEAVCAAERIAADNPADEDHAIFWLVLADQFEKRGIFSARVRDMALAIIDGGKDAEMMQKLGMKPADVRKRAANLSELRARIVAQPMASKPRKIMPGPEPYVLDAGGVYAYPTRGGEPINPFMGAKSFDRAAWRPDGLGLMLVIGRGRAFDHLAWYHAVTSIEVVPAVPERTTLVGEVRWGRPIYGTLSSAHYRKMELAQIGVFPINQSRIAHFFPHLAPGTTFAIQDISLANDMAIRGLDLRPRRWRRPDGKLELIAYPPPPTIAELLERPA